MITTQPAPRSVCGPLRRGDPGCVARGLGVRSAAVPPLWGAGDKQADGTASRTESAVQETGTGARGRGLPGGGTSRKGVGEGFSEELLLELEPGQGEDLGQELSGQREGGAHTVPTAGPRVSRGTTGKGRSGHKGKEQTDARSRVGAAPVMGAPGCRSRCGEISE